MTYYTPKALNYQGFYYQVIGQLGKLTLRAIDSDRFKRCVITSTLLGTLRKAADQDCE